MGSRLLVSLLVGVMTFSAAKVPVMATEGQEAHVYSAPNNLSWDTEQIGVGHASITDPERGLVYAALYRDGEKIAGGEALVMELVNVPTVLTGT